MQLPSSASAQRNKEPILSILKLYLLAKGTVLETASGTGEHINFFSEKFKTVHWQPSDKLDRNFWAIEKRTEQQNNVASPITIDLTSKNPTDLFLKYNAIININMIHISPWEATVGLFSLAKNILRKEGFIFTYGPYRVNGKHTSEGNENFDKYLRTTNSTWGVRSIEKVATLSKRFGFRLHRIHDMPMNNSVLIFYFNNFQMTQQKF